MSDNIFDLAVLGLGGFALANLAIAPWIHAYKLHQLTTRIEELEITIEDIFDGDDPGGGEQITEPTNIIAFAKVAKK